MEGGCVGYVHIVVAIRIKYPAFSKAWIAIGTAHTIPKLNRIVKVYAGVTIEVVHAARGDSKCHRIQQSGRIRWDVAALWRPEKRLQGHVKCGDSVQEKLKRIAKAPERIRDVERNLRSNNLRILYVRG